MFENIIRFFKRLSKKEKTKESSDTAKERLHLVLMQDRANVSADFLELMRQEIIEVIKKYVDIDEAAIDVKLTNKMNEDGTVGAPALYANIPISTIKNDARKVVEVKSKNEEKTTSNAQGISKKQEMPNVEKKQNSSKEKLVQKNTENEEDTKRVAQVTAIKSDKGKGEELKEKEVKQEQLVKTEATEENKKEMSKSESKLKETKKPEEIKDVNEIKKEEQETNSTTQEAIVKCDKEKVLEEKEVKQEQLTKPAVKPNPVKNQSNKSKKSNRKSKKRK